MNHLPHGELLLEASGVSKKFCKSLRTSMVYGFRDMFLSSGKRDQLRDDEFWAIRDVSLQLHRGEILAVLGLNGAGKSTLMRVITGTFPATTGTVRVNGRITTIYEKNNALNKYYTGRENIRVKCALFGLTHEEMPEAVESILQFAEIRDFADAPFGTYSAGMKARVNFATACFCKPDIIIIDEGLSASDARIVEKYTGFLKDRREKQGVLLVSHNQQLIRSLATRTVIMKEGQIIHRSDHVEEGLSLYNEHRGNHRHHASL